MDLVPTTAMLSFMPLSALAASHDGFLTCRECPSDAVKYVSIEELECHITADHMQFFPYECERCRFGRFPTLYAYVTHCRDEHKLTEFNVRYKYNEETERRMLEAKSRVYLSIHSSATGAAPSAYAPSASPDVKRIKLDLDDEPLLSGSAMGSPSPGSSSSGPPAAAGDDASSGSEGKPSTKSFKTKSLSVKDYQLMMNGGGTGGGETAEDAKKLNKPTVTCQMCGVSVSNQRSSLVYHANTKHSKLNLYECKKCHKTWNTIAKSDVLKHVKAVHGGDENMIIDNRKQLCTPLRIYTHKCFPPSCKPRGRPPMGRGSKGADDRERTPSDAGIGDDMDMEAFSDAPMEQLLQFANEQFERIERSREEVLASVSMPPEADRQIEVAVAP